MGDTARNGFYRHVTDADGVILPDVWNRCVGAGLGVGLCRVCASGRLAARAPEVAGRRRWFAAVCTDCGHEVLAPDGRTLPRRREPLPV